MSDNEDEISAPIKIINVAMNDDENDGENIKPSDLKESLTEN